MTPAQPADDAWLPVRRCSMCGISWPVGFDKCYECGGKTDLGRVVGGLA